MKEIYNFEAIDYLADGKDVFILLFTEKRPIVENAAIIPGRMLAKYSKMSGLKWYVTEEEDD